MKKIKIFSLLALLTIIIVKCSTDETVAPIDTKEDIPNIVINEFMASNDFAIEDPDDDGTGDNSAFDDWIEFYNVDSVAIDIGGMYVTDNLDAPTLWQIPNTDANKTTIQPGGFLVIWADGEMSQGVLHVNFSLSGGGEAIGLFNSDGITEIASLTYEPQQTDYSYGRNPDGSDTWMIFGSSTPGASNSGAVTNLPPQIKNITITPDSLSPTTPVIITAEVTDANDNLRTVKLLYTIDEGGGLTDKANDMTLDGTLYKAELGTFNDGTKVSFYIEADDDEGESAISDTLSFQVGFIAPVLFINEFLASNDSSYFDSATNDYPDWIEIFNPGTEAVDIGGMYITDDLSDLTVWQIPTTFPDSTTIPPGGFIFLLGDKNTDTGILHVNLKLSGSGEQIGLTASNGTSIIDSLTYTAQAADTSYGRFPDGSDNWQLFTTPTPGASNN